MKRKRRVLEPRKRPAKRKRQATTPPPAAPATAPAVLLVLPSKVGRRRTRIELTDEQLFTVAGLAASGATERAIAAQLGFSERALLNVFGRDQRARLAYDQGRAALETKLVGELVRRALDEKAPQSSVCLIFATKALLHLRDQGEPPAPTEGARLTLQVSVPRALPLDRYRELLARAERLLPAAAGGASE